MSLTGAAIPVFLSGKEYLVSPLRDIDLVELDEYVRSVHIQTAVNATLNAPQDAKRIAIERAVDYASSITFMSPQGAAIVKSSDGVARILWQGVKQNHPDMTHAELRALMYSPENVREANRVFAELNVKPLEGVLKAGKDLRARRQVKKTSTARSSKSSTSRRRK